MNRGARRATIFLDDECCGQFLELLGELPQRFGMVVHAYTLMPNHFHLMLESRSGRISQAMSYLQSRYSSWLNGRFDWDGPLYKGRFRNRVVDNDEYWRHLYAYLHLNPVRAHLYGSPDIADWTSHRAIVGLVSRPDWLAHDRMWEYYGSMEDYCEYLLDLQVGREQPPSGFEPDDIWEGPITGIVRLNLDAPRDVSSVVPVSESGDIEQRVRVALAEVQDVLGQSLDEILTPVRGRRGNRSRWIVAWWLSRWGRVPGKAIAGVLGIRPSGVSQMAAKAARNREKEPQLDEWMTRLEGVYIQP